ncbi:MAG: dihydroorotate dehydrogenase (quinone) [Rickettsiales bacterium]|nr:dihydroorotate dehydrogenase (quinone) [Rickettsiales bacterium]
MAEFLRPLLNFLDPETAHNLTLKALKLGAGPKVKVAEDERLHQTVLGLDFKNPIGLAAGFDKNAEVIRPMQNLGFGFLELGTITPEPQKGNPRPRVFRDERTGSVINMMGFPGEGLDVAKKNIENYLGNKSFEKLPIALNIGKNAVTPSEQAIEDYIHCTQEISLLADMIVINVSSPNTEGLRDMQHGQVLKELIDKVCHVRQKIVRGSQTKAFQPPLFVKLSPDLYDDELFETLQACVTGGVDGVILGNTSKIRPNALPLELQDMAKGGLSGSLIKNLALDRMRKAYQMTEGRLILVGTGGIENAQDVILRMKAGASLVQLYTALVYKGPKLLKRIINDLLLYMDQHNIKHISDIIADDHKIGEGVNLKKITDYSEEELKQLAETEQAVKPSNLIN